MRPLLVVLTPLLLLAPALAAPDSASPKERDLAIERALDYLDEAVWKLPDVQGTPRKTFTIAATGVVAHLAKDAGRLSRAEAADWVGRVTDALFTYLDEVERRSRDPDELPAHHGLAISSALIQYTWPSAVATLFFAECCARKVHRADSKEAVERFVRVLGEAQTADGGWGHGRARSVSKRTYPDTMVAASALVASSLGLVRRAVRPAGLAYLYRTPEYFRRAQLGNGNYPYDPSQRSADLDRLGAARTAGAVLALWAMDVPLDDPVVRKAVAYVDAHREDQSEAHGSATLMLLLSALSAKARGPEVWATFRQTFFRRILDRQRPDGSFGCIATGAIPGTTNDSKPMGGRGPAVLRKGADAYVTAIHAWILLLDATRPKTFEAPPARRGPAVTPR